MTLIEILLARAAELERRKVCGPIDVRIMRDAADALKAHTRQE